MATLTVHKAIYLNKDVTETVRAKIKDNSLHFTVNNDSLGGDPQRGTPKALTIVYSYSNLSYHIYESTFTENTTVDLDRASFEIVNAVWGVMEVTGIVRYKVKGGTLRFVVNNEAFGPDGWPSHPKKFNLFYRTTTNPNDPIQVITVDEGKLCEIIV